MTISQMPLASTISTTHHRLGGVTQMQTQKLVAYRGHQQVTKILTFIVRHNLCNKEKRIMFTRIIIIIIAITLKMPTATIRFR